MRLMLLFAGALLCGALAHPTSSHADGSAWCAHYGFDLDGTNCGFATFSQCMASISGNGGFCEQNLQYQPVPNQPAPRRYRRDR